jgi:hypothetical protein
MFICSRFILVSLQSQRMWSTFIFTAQKGHSVLRSLFITEAWVVLVYLVRRRLTTTCSPFFHCFRVCILFKKRFTLFHCWCSWCLFFINFFRSCGGYFSLSAVLLPGTLTWLGTHRRVIFEGFWSISFRNVCVLGFFFTFFYLVRPSPCYVSQLWSLYSLCILMWNIFCLL